MVYRERKTIPRKEVEWILNCILGQADAIIELAFGNVHEESKKRKNRDQCRVDIASGRIDVANGFINVVSQVYDIRKLEVTEAHMNGWGGLKPDQISKRQLKKIYPNLPK